MKILYVHQYFKTPEEGGSLRSYYLAKGLVNKGHEVHMITAHDGPAGTREIDGIHVHYLRVPYSNYFGFLRRILAFLAFVRLGKRTADTLCKKYRFDLAYVMTTPLTTGLIAMHIKEAHNVPYYFEVGDLWPEAPIKMGAIRNALLKRKLYLFERKCYFEAQRVVALSPAIRNYIESISPETKVHVLPNIADTTFFQPEYRLPKHFTRENPLRVAYIGTFGAANHLEFLIQAAKSCQEGQFPVEFSLMGDGATYPKIKQLASGLKNITLYPYGNADAVRELLQKQDAVYVSFKNIEILNTGSPNKFFDGLAAGKLIIINFGGWIRNVIEENDCGFYYDPLNPEEFLRKINVFLKDPELLIRYQSQARRLADSYYEKDLQVNKLLKIFNNEKKLDISESEVYILTA